MDKTFTNEESNFGMNVLFAALAFAVGVCIYFGSHSVVAAALSTSVTGIIVAIISFAYVLKQDGFASSKDWRQALTLLLTFVGLGVGTGIAWLVKSNNLLLSGVVMGLVGFCSSFLFFKKKK